MRPARTVEVRAYGREGCSFEECDRPHRAGGYCGGHYQQAKAGRELTPLRPRRTAVREREPFVTVAVRNLTERTVATGDGCVEWMGAKNQEGYGVVSIHGQTWMVHRLSYAMANGGVSALNAGMVVHHTCTNRACCSPFHLQMTDQADNVAEMQGRKMYERRIAELEAENASLREQLALALTAAR